MDGGKFLLQLLKVVAGFVLALVASGLFLVWGFFQAADPGENRSRSVPWLGPGSSRPALPVRRRWCRRASLIAIAEFARFKGIMFHLAAGGGIAFVIWTLGPEAEAGGVRPGSVVALAAGFFAGLVYWIIAGRTSGCWWLQKSNDPQEISKH